MNQNAEKAVPDLDSVYLGTEPKPDSVKRRYCRSCDGVGFVTPFDYGYPKTCGACSGDGHVEVEDIDIGASLARAGDGEDQAPADDWVAAAIFLGWAAFLVLLVVAFEAWPAIRSAVARWLP